MRVIFNADDFGLSAGVSQGILRSIAHGVVTSTSIMGNMPDLEPQIELLKGLSGTSLGIHLTLTAGQPVLAPGRVPSLVDKGGVFWRDSTIAVSRSDALDVEREWRAQIEAVLMLGISPTHLDSHRHLHLAPKLMTIALKLAKEYAVPCIRRLTVRDVWRESRPWRHALVLPHIAISQHLARGSGLRFPDGVIAFSDQILGKLARLSPGTYEVFCHPGKVDDALCRASSLRYERERELDFLTSPALKEGLRQLGVTLVTYRELAL